MAPVLLLALQGNDAIFLPLVFLHVISALAGFGSVGFAGTYASRAAHLDSIGGFGRSGVGPPAPPVSGPDAGEVGELPGSLDPAVGAGEIPGAGETVPAGRVAAEPVAADAEIEELTRYFERPARFWKAVLLVPVFGLLALWAEPHTKGLDQVWAIGALLVWALASMVVMGLVVPALNQMTTVLLAAPTGPTTAAAEHARLARLGRAGAMASRGAACCDLLFLVALALMIWQP